MIKKLLFWCFILTGISGYSQSVIFLHHSTGAGVYNEGNVAGWIANYNSLNSTNYQITERAFPDTPYPWENYPYDYWNLWINNQCSSTNVNIQCLGNIVQNYDVLIFKHCFPGADILANDGNPSVNSSIKTLANYQLQYRALRSLLDQYPQKKFIVWTLAPLHRLATNANNAARAKQFVDWVKTSWLTEDGKSHPNIYIFDFFSLVAETNQTPVNGQVNCLKYSYEGSHTDSDSHPNLLANQTVGPLFSQFIVNTIKNQTSGMESHKPDKYSLKVYPNPGTDYLTVDISELDGQVIVLDIYNMQGKLFFHKQFNQGNRIEINTSLFPSGSYLVRLETTVSSSSTKISINHN
jgi:hypothetical protein